MKRTAALRARIDGLLAERSTVLDAAQVIADATPDQDITAEDQATIDAALTRADEIDNEVKPLAAELAQLERITAPRDVAMTAQRQNGRTAPGVIVRDNPFDVQDVSRLEHMEARDRAMRVLDARLDEGEHGPAVEPARAEAIERLMANTDRLKSGHVNRDGRVVAQRVLLTEDPAYQAAFVKAMHGDPVFTGDEARAVNAFRNAAAIGTDSAGGFGVPVLIDPTIWLTGQGHPMDIMELADQETITTDEWKGVTSAGVTFTGRAEGATTADNAPTLAQPVITTRRADAYIPYSVEVGMDYPGFAEQMGALLNSAWDEYRVAKLTAGTNASNEPDGIVSQLAADTNVYITTTTASLFGAVDINRIWSALPIKWRRANARTAWMSHTETEGLAQAALSNLGDGSSFRYDQAGIFQLKGAPYAENDYFSAPSSLTFTTSIANLAVVGDWRNFKVVTRVGMNVELVPHLFDVTNNRPTLQRAWLAWARLGSGVISTAGFRLLRNKTS
jgi:HK97 family phage major capsid protein